MSQEEQLVTDRLWDDLSTRLQESGVDPSPLVEFCRSHGWNIDCDMSVFPSRIRVFESNGSKGGSRMLTLWRDKDSFRRGISAQARMLGYMNLGYRDRLTSGELKIQDISRIEAHGDELRVVRVKESLAGNNEEVMKLTADGKIEIDTHLVILP